MSPRNRLITGFFLGFLGIALLLFLFLKDNSQNITQEEFQTLLENASRFEVDSNYLYFWSKNKEYRLLKDENLLSKVKERFPIQTRGNLFWLYALIAFIFLLIACGVYFLYRYKKSLKASPINIPSTLPNTQLTASSSPSHKPTTPILPSTSNITLEHLAGITQIKSQLLEIIDYLKNPDKYTSLGLRMPKGILLVGPPGVGKTMLAKALASQSGVPFFYQSGSSFAQIFVGSGAKKVQELFAQAKTCKQAIIFIDEIDSVGKVRGNGRNDEREATLNQLLTEMDGFDDSSNLIIFGATNKAEVLDPALLRSGRLDRKIYVDLPTLQERVEIFTLYLQNKDFDFSIQEIAKDCAGFSGAMIENLINESGLLMLRQNAKTLSIGHIQEAKQNLLFSLKKFPSLNATQREILSLYQSAKAFYAYHAKINFEKIALWDEESIYQFEEFLSKTQLLQLLSFYLSGNEALKFFKKQTYSCASDDLAQAKKIAQDFLEKYGMGETLFETNTHALILEAQNQLHTLLQQEQEKILSLSQTMLAKEHLNPKDLDEIF